MYRAELTALCVQEEICQAPWAVGTRGVKRASHLVQNPVDGGHVDVADARDATCAVW